MLHGNFLLLFLTLNITRTSGIDWNIFSTLEKFTMMLKDYKFLSFQYEITNYYYWKLILMPVCFISNCIISFCLVTKKFI